jgi:lysophospholipase L1-like esterase
MNTSVGKWLRRSLVGVVALLAVSEGLVQVSGILDVPLYRADNRIGYIIAPNQSGSYLHLHDFHFNELSMAAPVPFQADRAHFNLLLIGDSIVLGGNPFREEERLGPRLAEQTGWHVWPISAGSWALQNELEYLDRHPDVVKAVDAVAIVSNSGDFEGPSSWASELTHPTHRPFPGLVYVFKKYVSGVQPPESPPQLLVAKRNWRVDLARFAATTDTPIFIFLYPDHEEDQQANLLRQRLYVYRPDIEKAVDGRAAIINVADAPQWNPDLYRDAVHPSVAGNIALAGIIARGIGARLPGAAARPARP